LNHLVPEIEEECSRDKTQQTDQKVRTSTRAQREYNDPHFQHHRLDYFEHPFFEVKE
jgi:hypothetical protein